MHLVLNVDLNSILMVKKTEKYRVRKLGVKLGKFTLQFLINYQPLPRSLNEFNHSFNQILCCLFEPHTWWGLRDYSNSVLRNCYCQPWEPY